MSVEGSYRAEDYIYIKAWCVLMRASPTHVKALQALAAAERAPLDALFKHYGCARWVRLVEFPSHMRERLERLA